MSDLHINAEEISPDGIFNPDKKELDGELRFIFLEKQVLKPGDPCVPGSSPYDGPIIEAGPVVLLSVTKQKHTDDMHIFRLPLEALSRIEQWAKAHKS